MNCPDCEREINNVWCARSVELEQNIDGKWIEKNVFSSNCSCPNCLHTLTSEELDELGIEGY